MQEHWIPGLERSYGEGHAIHAIILAGRIPQTEEPSRLLSIGVAQKSLVVSPNTLDTPFSKASKEMGRPKLSSEEPQTNEVLGLQKPDRANQASSCSVAMSDSEEAESELEHHQPDFS